MMRHDTRVETVREEEVGRFEIDSEHDLVVDFEDARKDKDSAIIRYVEITFIGPDTSIAYSIPADKAAQLAELLRGAVDADPQ